MWVSPLLSASCLVCVCHVSILSQQSKYMCDMVALSSTCSCCHSVLCKHTLLNKHELHPLKLEPRSILGPLSYFSVTWSQRWEEADTVAIWPAWRNHRSSTCFRRLCSDMERGKIKTVSFEIFCSVTLQFLLLGTSAHPSWWPWFGLLGNQWIFAENPIWLEGIHLLKAFLSLTSFPTNHPFSMTPHTAETVLGSHLKLSGSWTQ